MRKYRRLQKQKVAARMAIYKRVANGRIKRPEVCSDCGITCIPEAHHHKGYEREHRLDVIWLCQMCHKRLHTLRSVSGHTD